MRAISPPHSACSASSTKPRFKSYNRPSHRRCSWESLPSFLSLQPDFRFSTNGTETVWKSPARPKAPMASTPHRKRTRGPHSACGPTTTTRARRARRQSLQSCFHRKPWCHMSRFGAMMRGVKTWERHGGNRGMTTVTGRADQAPLDFQPVNRHRCRWRRCSPTTGTSPITSAPASSSMASRPTPTLSSPTSSMMPPWCISMARRCYGRTCRPGK